MPEQYQEQPSLFSYLKQLIPWSIGALVTLFIFHSLPNNSQFIEDWFSNGFFVFYRLLWDHSISLLPVAIIYILVMIIVASYWRFITGIKGWKNRLWMTALFILKISFIAIILFYWLWGFNYKRTDVNSLLQMDKERPSQEFIYDEYCRITDSLLQIREQFDPSLIREYRVENNTIRRDLERIFKFVELNVSGKVRVRKIRPRGVLLRFSTAGIYLPFVGEGHIDAGLHPITHPFTMMHEMSHGYGWTGEDDCNFFALLGCVNSADPFIRYSGYFGYWRYLRSQVFRLDRERFNLFYREIPEPLFSDYREVISYQDKYPNFLPRLRDLIYDNYLKSHGIADGLISYSQMIVLSYRWQQSKGTLVLNESPES